jgi:hypothetical protein
LTAQAVVYFLFSSDHLRKITGCPFAFNTFFENIHFENIHLTIKMFGEMPHHCRQKATAMIWSVSSMALSASRPLGEQIIGCRMNSTGFHD